MKIVDVFRIMLSDQLLYWSLRVAPDGEDKKELIGLAMVYMNRSAKRAEQALGKEVESNE